jgi:hypothetical protein
MDILFRPAERISVWGQLMHQHMEGKRTGSVGAAMMLNYRQLSFSDQVETAYCLEKLGIYNDLQRKDGYGYE